MKRTNQKGITLIALIVTIIVLIIIAGISIATLTGDNGVLQQTNAARVTQIEGTAREQVELACSAVKLAIEEAATKDSSYSAVDNSGKIQSVLLDVIQADTKELKSDGWITEGNAEDGDETFKIVYQGSDYRNACNDTEAKITYTFKLVQKSIEVTDVGTGLKDSEGNDVNINIGADTETGSDNGSEDEKNTFEVNLIASVEGVGEIFFTGEHSGTTLELSEETVLTFRCGWLNPQWGFDGWYVGEECISSDADFTDGYLVDKAQTIVARFTQQNPNDFEGQ